MRWRYSDAGPRLLHLSEHSVEHAGELRQLVVEPVTATRASRLPAATWLMVPARRLDAKVIPRAKKSLPSTTVATTVIPRR